MEPDNIIILDGKKYERVTQCRLIPIDASKPNGPFEFDPPQEYLKLISDDDDFNGLIE